MAAMEDLKVKLNVDLSAVTEAVEALKKIKGQLDWRGPTGKKMGHVVITRADAVAMLGYEDAP